MPPVTEVPAFSRATNARGEQIFVQVKVFEHFLSVRKNCGRYAELTFRNCASITWTEI
jgi:hypothetical protein